MKRAVCIGIGGVDDLEKSGYMPFNDSSAEYARRKQIKDRGFLLEIRDEHRLYSASKGKAGVKRREEHGKCIY
jgi:hypothetical protein